MSKKSLEERVSALEKQMEAMLSAHAHDTRTKDWRRTIGAFTGDDVMKEIFEAGRQVRESERVRAQKNKRS